jgi:hypothetical protein
VVDMSAGAVTERLRQLAQSRQGASPSKVDMTRAAVTLRLREWASLTLFCLRLGRAGRSLAGPP